MRSGHAEWEGCLEGCVGGGAIVSPLGRSLELPALCVSLSEGLRPEATKEGPTERAAEASREEGGS